MRAVPLDGSHSNSFLIFGNDLFARLQIQAQSRMHAGRIGAGATAPAPNCLECDQERGSKPVLRPSTRNSRVHRSSRYKEILVG